MILKRSWAGEVRNISVLIAIGVGTDGYRQILGVAEGEKEDLEGWSGFLRHLKDRGIKGVQLMISDACRGLIEAAGELYPEARWQRCVVHFYRNVLSHAPNSKVAEVARMLKAIHAQEDRAAALAKNIEVAAKLRAMKLQRVADLVSTHGAGRRQAPAYRLNPLGKASISRDGIPYEPRSTGDGSLTADRATANQCAKESLHHQHFATTKKTKTLSLRDNQDEK